MLTVSQKMSVALSAAADAMIHNALTYGAVGYPAPLAGEVEAAHAVVLAGASQLATVWSPLLAPLKVQVRSWAALIHASPKVTFTDTVTGNPENRELAYVLVVIDHKRAGAVVDRRAELIQAKVVKPRGGLGLDKSGKAQRNLYMHWPPFEMPAGYIPGPRDLHDPKSHGKASDGCRFGGIALKNSLGWFQITPAIRMNIKGAPELGPWITEMALGTAGRQAVAGGGDTWSLLIDELLLRTRGRSFPAGGGDRLVETLSFTFTAAGPMEVLRSIAAFVSPPRSTEDPPTEAPEEGGISTIYVELTSNDG
ncbi:MAG: hypothetical protein ACTMKV_08275 [Sphingomonas parapaucimobilis]